MKKGAFSILLAGLILALALVGCGGKKPFTVDEVVEGLNGSNAFSETLEGMERSVFVRYYGLDNEALEDGAAYGSTGATAEEFAVLVFVDEAGAEAAEAVLRAHVSDQLEANRDYRPGDIPKLEKAVVERRENTLLLLVANDYEAADKALG